MELPEMNDLKRYILELKKLCKKALTKNKESEAELLRGAIHAAEESLSEKHNLIQFMSRLRMTREDALKDRTDLVDYLDYLIDLTERHGDITE